MAVAQNLLSLVDALLGIVAFAPPTQPGPEIGDESVNAARYTLGGNLETMPRTRLRWYPPDIERAQFHADDSGDISLIGQLSQSMELDGVIRGLGDARASVVGWRKEFYGSREVIDVLRSMNNSDRDVLDEMIPRKESRLMVKDGMKCGLAIGEMCPVRGRNFPVLVRRFPEKLYFNQSKNQWYYRSVAGNLPIQPGVPNVEGNWWVFHMPGGRLKPWDGGLWSTLGRSYINKTQTLFARQAYEFRHSQPARVAEANIAATQDDRENLLQRLIRWAMNSAFVLPPGYTLKLVESNGQGTKVYTESITTYNAEIATAYCGSAAMLQGTVGFTNMDVFRVVQKDLIASTAEDWDHTVNTQILPAFIAQRWGIDALRNATRVVTDVSAPIDRSAEAAAYTGLANAVKGLVEALQVAQQAATETEPVAIDVTQLFARYGVPTKRVAKLVLVPTGGTGGTTEPPNDDAQEEEKAA